MGLEGQVLHFPGTYIFIFNKGTLLFDLEALRLELEKTRDSWNQSEEKSK